MIKEALGNFDIPTIREIQKDTKSPDLSHIPGGSGWPILGHFYPIFSDMQKYLKINYEKHGPVFRFSLPGMNAVILLGPDANRLVFQNESKNFSNFIAWDFLFRGLFDNNILEQDFSHHKATRRTLQSAFKKQAIEGHIEIMNPLMEARIARWPSGREVKAMDHVKELLLDIGANVFLGIQMGAEAKKLNSAFVDIVAGTADPFKRKELFFSPYAKGVRGRRLLSKFVFNNIGDRRNNPGRDIFSQLCHLDNENGRKLTSREVRDQIIFVLFAAHDTTTSALSAILYSLATNSDWQEKLRQEIFSLGKNMIEFEDFEKLVLTGWTFKEALRMYPALAGMPRHALDDFEYAGHRIPANTPVLIFPVFSHHMEEYWTNPYIFDPERFSTQRAEDKKHFFQYAPFGGGAHKCLGMHFAEIQAKMFLFYLLKNYRVSKDPKMKKYNFNHAPMTFPTDGLPLTFTRI